MVVSIAVMRFNDSGSYYVFNRNRNREWGRVGEGVVLLGSEHHLVEGRTRLVVARREVEESTGSQARQE